MEGGFNPHQANDGIIINIPLCLKADNEALIKTAEAALITSKATAKAGYNKISITKPEEGSITKYQIYRSTKKSSGYKRIKTTAKITYKDTKKLAAGTKYYYKVRGVSVINGKNYYTKWSKVVAVTAK